MAVPQFRAAGSISSGTGARTPNAPTGLAVNDVELLLVETANETASLDTANGFALLTTSTGQGTAGSTDATRMTVFWRRWDGVAGNPTVGDAGDHVICIRLAFSGCITTGNPWDVAGVSQQTSATTSGSIPQITTLTDESLVVFCLASDLPDANSTDEFSNFAEVNLESIAELTDNTRNSGNGGAVGSAAGEMATAGAIGTTTYTSAETSLKDHVTIALIPALTGTTSVVDPAASIVHAPAVTVAVGAVTRIVASAAIVLSAPAVAVVTGAVTRAVDPAPIVAFAPDVAVALAITRTVDSSASVAHAPGVLTAVGAITRVVDAGAMVFHAPDVQTTTGAVIRSVGPSSDIWLAPTVTASAAAGVGPPIILLPDRKSTRRIVKPSQNEIATIASEADPGWQYFWEKAPIIVPMEGDPRAPVNYGNYGRQFTRGAGTAAVRNGGLALNATSDLSRIELPLVETDLDGPSAALNDFTVFIIASATAFVTTNSVALSVSNGHGDAGQLLIFYPFDDNGGDGFRTFWNGAQLINQNDGTFNDGKPHVFALTSRGSTDHEQYVDGLSVGTSGSANSLNTNTDRMTIGNWNTQTFNPTNGGIYAVYWLRTSDIDVADISRRLVEDPFAPVRKRARTIPFVLDSEAPVAGDQTVTVVAAPMVAQAPAVTVVVGAITRAVDVAADIWHAPAVVTATTVNRSVDTAVDTWRAPAVTVAVGAITRAVDPGPIAWQAPTVAVAVGAVTRVVAAAPTVFHAPAVVASVATGVTTIVGVASTIWRAPSVATSVGAVSRTVGAGTTIWRAPEVATATVVTVAVGSAVTPWVAPDVVRIAGAVTRAVDPGAGVAHAPTVATVAGAVTRTVDAASMVWTAPAVTATIVQDQTVVVGVAAMPWSAPSLQNAFVRIPAKLPTSVVCDVTVTSVACDDTRTSVDCDSTVTSFEIC